MIWCVFVLFRDKYITAWLIPILFIIFILKNLIIMKNILIKIAGKQLFLHY